MLRHNEDSILGKIIFLSETLQGSKLEDDSLDKARAELQEVSSYLCVDEISAIFFAVIFVLQNQRSMEVNLHDIAEFLNYSLDVRSKIWQSKMPELPLTEAKRLADQFDFSGGEIDNVVRKCEMSEVIKGARPSYEEVVDLCKNERLEKEGARSIGFSFS